jgi:hypothetical protein
MKAITLHQPWAAAMFLPGSLSVTDALLKSNPRLKRFETRSWATSYRGRIAIHAGKSHEGEDFFDDHLDLFLDYGIVRWTDLDFGAVLGTVALVDCYGTHLLQPRSLLSDDLNVTDLDYQMGDFSPGRYAWVTKGPIELSQPVTARGHQGIWNWRPPAWAAEELSDA